MKKILLISTVLLTFILACSFTSANQNTVATSVAETMQAVGDDAPQPEPQTPTEAPEENIFDTGTAEGYVCFPSEYLPAMYLYFENVDTLEVTKLPIPENQGNFSAPLPPGTYTAYAWLTDFTGGGTYSQAVPCGLSVDCTDHSLLPFEVIAGQAAVGIEVCDWYGGPQDVPLPPADELAGYFGSITGALGYPSESIPPMDVVAFNTNSLQFFYVQTQQNDGSYTIENLPPGPYQVVAYPTDSNFGGGYSEFVLCGQTVECADHTLITVQVIGGQTTTDVDPLDFYAPQGTFPDNPVP